MRGWRLSRRQAARGDFRDADGKKRSGFLCARPQKFHLCNPDHITKRWGVEKRRMRSACQMPRLVQVKPIRVSTRKPLKG